MRCPACSNELSNRSVNGIEIDICNGGCGGIWFDNYEFKKFDEPHEYAGKELLEVKKDPNLIIDYTKKRHCPRCENITMMRHFFSVKKEVEVDECAGCAGIWLDGGELDHIRSLFSSEDEKKEAAEKVFNDTFGSQLEALTMKSKENRNNARRIANMFKFICPSHYISGIKD